jgi:hypothetical protein
MDRMLIDDIFAFVAAIVGMGCFTGLVVTWIRYRARKSLASPELLRRLDELVDRMSRLEPAIDAVAVEVERISEAQRFTTKLLAERPGSAALADRSRLGGSTTPH